jgi:Family of unknown function (DUF6178)
MRGPMADTRQLVRRLLEAPDIARVVPRLPAEVLHRLIEHCGLEACADIVALTRPRQLERLLDLDLWRAPAGGADETFDVRRFGEWIEMLLQSGIETAAQTLAGMDPDVVIGGLSEHVAVFDGAKVAPYTMLHGVEVAGRAFRGRQVSEIGGYVVEGRESSAWEAIVELLSELQDERPGYFHRVMRGVVARSNGPREADGFYNLLDDRDQQRADLASARETRRDAQGYVAAAQARAFLHASRGIRLDGAQPPIDPVARGCLRAIEPEPLSDDETAAIDHAAAIGTKPACPERASASRRAPDPRAMTAVIEILSDAGVVTRPRALLGAGDADHARLARVRAFVDARLTAPEELAFLANALVAGCAIQGRPFTMPEASDAVLSTCNLGLENWPDGWPACDLITAFQVGWTILHRDLCLHGAAALIDVLTTLECDDRDVQWSLETLRRELIRHARDGEPWRARHALDAILMLDAPAWAVLCALLDECPAVHAALGPASRARLKIDVGAITFVARNSEIAPARSYLASLASALTG